MSETPPGGEGPKRRSPWRWVRRLVVALVGLVVLLIAGLIAGRAYFNDARLRALIESEASRALHAEVKLAKLTLNLGSDVTLDGLCIGPPPGFTRNVLCVERVHVAWDLAALRRKELIIPDLSARSVSVCLEQNEHGMNVTALVPPGPEAPPAATKEPLTQPDLPVRVALSHFDVSDVSVDIVMPTMSAFVDKVGMNGSFEGFHEAMAVNLWAGFGDSHARFAQPGMSLTSVQHGGVSVRSSGFGDVAIKLDLATSTDVRAPYALPTITTAAAASAKVNLLEEKAALESASFQLDRNTKVELALHATDFLSNPTVVIDALNGGADLAELSPLVAAVVPDIRMKGKVQLAAAPTTVPIADATHPAALTTNLSAEADKVAIAIEGYDVDGLSAKTTIGLADGIVAFHADTTIRGVVTPQGSAAGVTAMLEATTPLQPWMDATQDGSLIAVASAKVAHADAPAAVADGLAAGIKVNGPIRLLLGGTSNDALVTHATVALASATAQGNSVRGLSAVADIKQRDLAASVCDVQAQASIDSVSSALPQGTVSLPKLATSLKLSRRGQSFDVPVVTAALGDIMQMHATAKVDAAMSPAPRITSVTFDLDPTSIPALVAIVPRSMRPPATIAGSMRAHVSARGTLPYVELVKAAQMPDIPEVADIWGATIAAYMKIAGDWAKRLGTGLPFSGEATFAIDKLAYSDQQAALDGGQLGVTATLTPHGPSLAVNLAVAKILRPQMMNDVRFQWTADVHGAHATSRALGVIGALAQPGFASPLRDTAFEMSAHYDLAGDAVLDRFAVTVPAVGVSVDARAMIKTPVDVLIARSWEQPGLPGVSIDSAYELRVASFEPMTLGAQGPQVSGELASRGSLVLERGEADIIGDVRMNKLSAKVGENELVDMTGSLPFDVRLAFDGRDGTTPLMKGVSFGEVSLITAESGSTAGLRPTYYDRLKDYQGKRGITAKRLSSGPYAIENLIFDCGMAAGRLTANTLSMHLLGGDIVGNLSFRLASDRSIGGDMDMKVSNIDASFFPALNLEPGPDSEMNADMHMTFGFAPHHRDLDFNMNVTKIGSKTLDRFLQLLDPDKKNDGLQRTRGQLKFVRINNVAMWVRYENLNMDIDVTTFLRIPFTNIGFPNIDRELLRRYSISEQLDFYVQRDVDKTLAPFLGWHD